MSDKNCLMNPFGCAGWQGEMAQRIAALDWSSTALGPRADWSKSLNAAILNMLACPVPLVMLWGTPGTMIYNDAYAGFAGGRHPYLLGRPVEEGWPEIAQFNRNVVDTCLSGATLSYKDKQLALQRSGQLEDVWMDLHYSPVAEDDGHPAGVLAIVFETTGKVLAERQKRRAETAAREANERLQLALSSGLVLGTWVWEFVGDRFTGDERFSHTFGLDRHQVAGEAVEHILRSVHPDDRERVRDQLHHTFGTDGQYRAEYRVRMASGEYRWVLASGRCEYDAAGRPRRLPGVVVDIHERKMAEEELLKLTQTLEQRVTQAVTARVEAEERLRQVQKLEAIGGLTGGVAHDFNNVLQIISANLQLLSVAVRDQPNLERRIDVASQAVTRGARLAAQLLAFARRQPLSPSVVNMTKLLRTNSDLLRRALPETIELAIDVSAPAWNLFADKNQLENALLNLVINSRDAITRGGVVRLQVSNVDSTQDARASALRLPQGEYVRISVEDNGSGMTEQVKARAFEPFFSTKREGHGTGLGLSMVFGFMAQSAGHVDIQTSEGKGTTVSLYFPRCHEDERAEGATQAVRASRGGETILIAEDDPAVRLAAVDMLAQLGYKVLSAQDGDAALSILRGGTHIDVLFTDVVMPGTVRSSELARIAAGPPHSAKVVFASGYTRDIIVHEGRLDEGVVLLRKPYTMHDLAQTIRRVLNSD